MSGRHETIEESLAVRALDGLDPDEGHTLETALGSHGDCATCRELEAAYADTAAFLAVSLDPVPISDAATERLLIAARAVRAPSAPRISVAPPVDVALPVDVAPPVDELAGRRRRRALPGWLAAAAAFVLLAVVVVPRLGGATDVTTEWSQTVVRFQGSDGEFAMAYVPGETGVAFWGDDLPDPGADRTYEIWMIDDGTPIKGGCVAPVDGRIAVYVEANVGTTDTMAVTVEPTSCPEEPTSDPVLTAQLS